MIPAVVLLHVDSSEMTPNREIFEASSDFLHNHLILEVLNVWYGIAASSQEITVLSEFDRIP